MRELTESDKRDIEIELNHLDNGKGSGIMSNIRFYIPQYESIPTDLRLYVGENYVKYERTANGFLFKTLIDDEDDAMKVVEQIVNKMKSEHDESEHGVSWRTISLAVVPQEERYKIGTWVEWKYRVRDS